nr:MAG TPA: hypothetical protein [Caudoviricetes sp.]
MIFLFDILKKLALDPLLGIELPTFLKYIN